MSKLIFAKFDSLPEFLTSNHLVDLGLYNSVDAAYAARVKGKSPVFIQVKRKVLYPKSSVIQFIEHYMHLPSVDAQGVSLEAIDQNSII